MFSVKHEKMVCRQIFCLILAQMYLFSPPSPGGSLEEYIPVPPDGSDGIVYEIACVNLAEIHRGVLQSTEVDLSRPRWISASNRRWMFQINRSRG